jgi:histidyl-tRNA synthetase
MTDTQRSVKAQFKDADRSRARSAVVVGSEWADGDVTAKDLESGDQKVISAKEIKVWLQGQ